MVDTGEADKLVNYKAAGNSIASRHAGLWYKVRTRFAEALFVRLPKAIAENRHRPNSPFGLCTRLIPVCGGNTHTKTPAFPISDDKALLLPTPAILWKKLFIRRGVGENIALV